MAGGCQLYPPRPATGSSSSSSLFEKKTADTNMRDIIDFMSEDLEEEQLKICKGDRRLVDQDEEE